MKSFIPVISIVGKSNTGKTTLIEKLIPELVKRGYRVATIKHHLHDFDIDVEGKDSWRHRQAGARATIVATPRKVALIEDVEEDFSIEVLRERYVHDVDLILTEGFKGNPHPKIEIYRAVLKRELLCGPEDNLLALASDTPLKIGVPCLDINDTRGLVDLIEATVLKK
ncbi:molybdopterin guanine dinucleotide biosynthesis accessory protein MobB [Syntrophus gentianae]|uniref:Molybdopterin guanine dinucleotide biosynthesis accessory protein MobB n=1 Tax=Syntrophus gentianae TaxID=43775 RepID=A0A1H7VR26_9BACT|nr:molybdopterin-guanine dinucleotide biosynthesis protein B [Syntrophus gentianae]SEM11713.1 molybdopterin guanine dinucleotide biosynthesis accessory protein MobB [Syntrophus gentianae]